LATDPEAVDVAIVATSFFPFLGDAAQLEPEGKPESFSQD